MTSLNLFQIIALVVILVLLCYELTRVFRQHVIRSIWAMRVVAWIMAGIAICRPSDVTRLAQAVGIQRGADLVLYLTALVFIGVSLYLYARTWRLQQQITSIVRHIAIQEVREPSVGDQSPAAVRSSDPP